MVEMVSNLYRTRDDIGKKILILAVVIIGLMVLFPPKYIVNKNPLLGLSSYQSAGYCFILSDPAGEQKSALKELPGGVADDLVGSGIEWGKLFLQIAIVVGLTVVGLRFMTKQQSGGTAG